MVDIKAEIERIVREQLAGSAIDDVRVVDEYDDDGDHLLKITIVYSSNLDKDRMKGLVRHLRSSLTEGRRFTFPLVSYRSKKDDMRFAAA